MSASIRSHVPLTRGVEWSKVAQLGAVGSLRAGVWGRGKYAAPGRSRVVSRRTPSCARREGQGDLPRAYARGAGRPDRPAEGHRAVPLRAPTRRVGPPGAASHRAPHDEPRRPPLRPPLLLPGLERTYRRPGPADDTPE